MGQTLRANLRWGLLWAAWIVAGFSLIPLAIYAVRGDEPFRQRGVTLGTVLLSYVAAGAMGGVTIGLLRPLSASRIGGAIVGNLVAFMVFVVGGIWYYGFPQHWEAGDWVVVAGLSVIFGTYLGITAWEKPGTSHKE